MISELILIRHGIAEKKRDDLDDAERQLTVKGKDELKKSMPSLIYYLEAVDEINIWSSPLPRAAQTARIIAKALHARKPTCFDFIRDGDFTGLVNALARYERSGCLILVGHEPQLGEWSEKICGCKLIFKKGAAAGFRITDPASLSGELQWFTQPKFLRRIGK